MKNLLTFIIVLIVTNSVCFGETIKITATPESFPLNLGLGSYSPMIEFTYDGLVPGEYTMKDWLLGGTNCASGQWCEATYTIDGTNPSGQLRIVKNMDVYGYSSFSWIARLYNSSGVQVAADLYYWDNKIPGSYNRPPVLGTIGNQQVAVGETLSFLANATDPESNTITYSATVLPIGATMSSEGFFEWSPLTEGEYTIYVHANDGQTYDSEELTINVGPPVSIEFQTINVPSCGTNINVTGFVTGLTNWENYRIVCGLYISGSGLWTKPYAAAPLSTIYSDGSFNIDITTGGIDSLATIVYLGVCHKDAEIPVWANTPSIPEDLPVYCSSKIYRDPTECHRTIQWSGRTWWVKKSGSGALGPGPNFFSDSEDNVFVDIEGNLHLKIINDDGTWKCSEIISVDSFGYGVYEFDILGDPGLDENSVGGLFTWIDDDASNFNREIDIEFITNPPDNNAQYVIQPWSTSENIDRFDMPWTNSVSTHRFNWKSDSVEFQSVYSPLGWLTALDIVNDWTYSGENVPAQGEVNVRLNLWLMNGLAPSNGLDQEVVIKDFRFLCPLEIEGDINKDCRVDMIDFAILAANWLEEYTD